MTTAIDAQTLADEIDNARQMLDEATLRIQNTNDANRSVLQNRRRQAACRLHSLQSIADSLTQPTTTDPRRSAP